MMIFSGRGILIGTCQGISDFAMAIQRFMSRIGLVSLWERHQVDYTHMHTDYKSTSVIDHFIMNERLLSLVVDCGPLYLGDNRSMHSPILVKFNLGAMSVKQVEIRKYPRRPELRLKIVNLTVKILTPR